MQANMVLFGIGLLYKLADFFGTNALIKTCEGTLIHFCLSESSCKSTLANVFLALVAETEN